MNEMNVSGTVKPLKLPPQLTHYQFTTKQGLCTQAERKCLHGLHVGIASKIKSLMKCSKKIRESDLPFNLWLIFILNEAKCYISLNGKTM